MKKFSITLILKILAFVSKALLMLIDSVKDIADLVDDGKVNDSFEFPEWLLQVEEIFVDATSLYKKIFDVSFDLEEIQHNSKKNDVRLLDGRDFVAE